MTRKMTVKPKGLKLRILLMQHRCIRVQEGTKLKQDTFSLFEATTVDTRLQQQGNTMTHCARGQR